MMNERGPEHHEAVKATIEMLRNMLVGETLKGERKQYESLLDQLEAEVEKEYRTVSASLENRQQTTSSDWEDYERSEQEELDKWEKTRDKLKKMEEYQEGAVKSETAAFGDYWVNIEVSVDDKGVVRAILSDLVVPMYATDPTYLAGQIKEDYPSLIKAGINPQTRPLKGNDYEIRFSKDEINEALFDKKIVIVPPNENDRFDKPWEISVGSAANA